MHYASARGTEYRLLKVCEFRRVSSLKILIYNIIIQNCLLLKKSSAFCIKKNIVVCADGDSIGLNDATVL